MLASTLWIANDVYKCHLTEHALSQHAQVSPLWESVPPKLYGGTERIVSYVTEELVRMGHDVTLFEKAAELGGQFNLAKKIPGKQEFAESVAFYAERLRRAVALYLAVRQARAEGIKVGLLRPITLWPYPAKALVEAAQNCRTILVVEMSTVSPAAVRSLERQAARAPCRPPPDPAPRRRPHRHRRPGDRTHHGRARSLHHGVRQGARGHCGTRSAAMRVALGRNRRLVQPRWI